MKRTLNVLIYVFAAIGLVLTLGYVAILLNLTDSLGIVEGDQNRFLSNPAATDVSGVAALNVDTSWSTIPEWQTFKSAVAKDVPLLMGIEDATGISSRLIMSIMAVEQLRLYYDNREVYKKIFEPLKLLGSQSQFSWGVMGIKQETAEKVERNLKDRTSPFYIGIDYEHLLDFKTTDIEAERFNRITDQHAHYYSYLYAALFIKEIEAQWLRAGFDISKNVGVLGTLYNIGFERSIPKAAPEVGGAAIVIDGKTYSFGGLAYNIYYSNELLDSFPRK